MKMKAQIAITLLVPTITQADYLTDQINAVDRVHQQGIQRQNDEIQRARDSAIQQQKEERMARERIEAKRIAAYREQQQRNAAATKARNEERLSDKRRYQNQEDEDRAIELENKRLELQMKRAKAARADEYVTQDLGREKATTDVIQSNADANRTVSQGEKELRTGIGKGAEAEGKSLFR